MLSLAGKLAFAAVRGLTSSTVALSSSAAVHSRFDVLAPVPIILNFGNVRLFTVLRSFFSRKRCLLHHHGSHLWGISTAVTYFWRHGDSKITSFLGSPYWGSSGTTRCGRCDIFGNLSPENVMSSRLVAHGFPKMNVACFDLWPLAGKSKLAYTDCLFFPQAWTCSHSSQLNVDTTELTKKRWIAFLDCINTSEIIFHSQHFLIVYTSFF